MVKALKINKLVVITTKPAIILKEIEKVLRKHAGKDWTYDFSIDET